MKIMYENAMPFGHEYLSTLGEAIGFDGPSLRAEQLRKTDVLAVRSTTKVNAALLSGADCLKLVSTATAGINHMDTALLDSKGIAWHSAAGCNAKAVAEYVLSVIFCAHDEGKIDLSRAKVGIIGAGHVGSALAGYLDALGIHYLLNDPPLLEQGDSRAFDDIDAIWECDVITLHVPFVQQGKHVTTNMVDSRVLQQLTSKQLLINACRGEVIDQTALKQRLQQSDAPVVALDVFYNEPNIDVELLEYVWLATPHIAGHSVEGKVGGTQLVYERVCEQFGQLPTLTLGDFVPSVPPLTCPDNIEQEGAINLAAFGQLLFSVYDIRDDDRFFRQGMAKLTPFTQQRKEYRVRRECSAYSLVPLTPLSASVKSMLIAIGFQVV